MTRLNLAPNLGGHDDIYQSLVALHDGLTEAESLRLWARLTLILMNHIGDAGVIAAALDAARPPAPPAEPPAKSPAKSPPSA